MSTKTILIFNEYYLPGYKAGGPIRSISNLVSWLGDGFNFKIITTDRDSSEEEPYEGIKVNAWNQVGKADVYYMGKENIGFTHVYYLLKQTDYDAIYLNSLFGLQYSLIPLLLLQYVIQIDSDKIFLAPRGQLSDGALAQSSLKKKLFLYFIKLLGCHKKIRWHATNEIEKNEIIDQVGIAGENIYVTSNLPQKKSRNKFTRISKKEGSLRIVFLSRVDMKKNLDYALRILKDIHNVRVTFDIYGNIDNQKYWEECKSLIATLPSNVNVQYKGFIKHSKVNRTLGKYHLFFLPTKGENYGHAIYEAMLAGTPVLISDQTPWLQLEGKGLGWSISLDDPEKYKKVIRKLGQMDKMEINGYKDNVYHSIKKLDIEETVNATKLMFKSMI